MSTHLPNVHFSITDCHVKTSTKKLVYKIFKNKCPNKKINFKILNNLDQKLTKFSYKVFEFAKARHENLTLSCDVIVCDMRNLNSKCREMPNCENKGKDNRS